MLPELAQDPKTAKTYLRLQSMKSVLKLRLWRTRELS